MSRDNHRIVVTESNLDTLFWDAINTPLLTDNKKSILQQIATKFHDTPKGYFAQAWVLKQKEPQNFDALIDLYSKAIAKEPDFAPAYYGRGISYFTKGDYSRSIEDFTKRIDLLRPNQKASTLLKRAIAYELLGKSDLALKDIKMSAQLGEQQSVLLLEQIRIKGSLKAVGEDLQKQADAGNAQAKAIVYDVLHPN
jgi:tetratricopeptide (TPR) repeat protein